MMAVRNLIKCSSKGLTSNILNFRMAEVFSQHVGLLSLSQRMPLRPYSRRRLKKDSDFEHTDEGEAYEYSEEVLNQQLDDKMRELESHAHFTKKVMMKKYFFKRQKQPRMLTYCETLQIKALHKSNPDEWTPEILSECFPALPYMIRTIVKSKWKPQNLEKVKAIDKLVLENWEKLKRNELEVSPKYLEHLKNFINKSNILKLQINNPNFSYLLPEESIFENKTGVFTTLIKDYEEELNSLTKAVVKSIVADQSKIKQLSLEDGTSNDLILNDNTANDLTLKESNTTKLKADMKEKGLIPEYLTLRSKDKLVTLDELKQSIFRKAEKCRSLSESDKEIIRIALTRHHLPPSSQTGKEVAVKSTEITEEALSETTEIKPRKSYEEVEKAPYKSTEKKTRKSYEEVEKAPYKSTEKKPRKLYEEMEKTENVSDRNINLTNEDTPSEEEGKRYSNLFYLTRLNFILNPKESKPPSEGEEAIPKKEKTPVCYYGTEKDEEVYKKLEEDIYNTVFWKSEKEYQSIYKNMSLTSNPNSFGPILEHKMRMYPEKIKIPEGVVEKGKLYKLNDCYYDDNGNFLYRVPGMK